MPIQPWPHDTTVVVMPPPLLVADMFSPVQDAEPGESNATEASPPASIASKSVLYANPSSSQRRNTPRSHLARGAGSPSTTLDCTSSRRKSHAFREKLRASHRPANHHNHRHPFRPSKVPSPSGKREPSKAEALHTSAHFRGPPPLKRSVKAPLRAASAVHSSHHRLVYTARSGPWGRHRRAWRAEDEGRHS